MFERIGRIALPPWFMPVVLGTTVGVSALIAAFLAPSPDLPDLHLAFIGNSMMYYNDFPRFMEAISDGHVTQNSCLHGDATLGSILHTGNGLYNEWDTGSARVFNDAATIHDFGACTVPQLLFGYDAELAKEVEQKDDDGREYDDDSDTRLVDDGENPCLQDDYYFGYLQALYTKDGTPKYDFIVMNDNTRSPARKETREAALEVLEQDYVPWFLETKATPVLICTYGYDTPYRDMGGLGTVSEFTSLTYEGYRQYSELLEELLPESQKPRISPVCLAFLIVYEENYSLWERLFHVDKIHASPLGTFLQGCVVFYTLFGRMPKWNVAIRSDMSYLWMDARRFQPGIHRRSPFPTQSEAAYLYDVAQRVVRYGHAPKTLIRYENNEAADFTPQDDLFRVDDLF